MSGRRPAVVLAVVVLLSFAARGAQAQGAVLTRARVAELARGAPLARVAQKEEAVARAGVSAAGVLSLENPTLSAMGGLRVNPDESRPFAGVATLSWPVDLGGQPSGRLGAARAEEHAAVTRADHTRRSATLAALLQHALVLRDQRQVALASERRALAQRLAAAAEQRRKAGSVPELDVSLAVLQERRDAAAEEAAEGSREADQAELIALLGLPGGSAVEVVGPLVPPDEPPPLPTALQRAGERTDVRAAAAEVDVARARASREQAARWPTISILAQYERDDRANIGMLGLAIPIPVLNANRSGAAIAEAEIGAAAARLDASRAAADGQIREKYARHAATRRALEALAPTADLAATAVAQATRAYELGEGDLAGVLLARREAIEAQAALLEAEHAHANAKLELLVAAGRVPQ